jgi:hypothetical protein
VGVLHGQAAGLESIDEGRPRKCPLGTMRGDKYHGSVRTSLRVEPLAQGRGAPSIAAHLCALEAALRAPGLLPPTPLAGRRGCFLRVPLCI